MGNASDVSLGLQILMGYDGSDLTVDADYGVIIAYGPTIIADISEPDLYRLRELGWVYDSNEKIWKVEV